MGEQGQMEAGGWSFEPNWLIGTEAKDGVLEELSTCPSWLTLDNNATGVGTTGGNQSRLLGNGTPPSLCAARSKLRGDGGNEKTDDRVLLLRSRVSCLEMELGKQDSLYQHLQAQNTMLRNKVHEQQNVNSDLNAEIHDLHEHIGFLRHITAPTPDAGALDVSLAVLRGHELEQARCKEKEAKQKADNLAVTVSHLELDLENQKKLAQTAQNNLETEVEKMQLEIAKVAALKSSQQSSLNNVEHRYNDLVKQHTHEIETLKQKHKVALDLAVEEAKHTQAAKRFSEICEAKETIKRLESQVDEGKRSADALSKRCKEQHEQLELAWAEIHGLGASDALHSESVRQKIADELDKQRVELETKYAKEMMVLKREITHLQAHQVQKKTMVNVETNTDKDDGGLVERLGVYHAQLQRATSELKRLANDNRLIFGRYLASCAARKALQIKRHNNEDLAATKSMIANLKIQLAQQEESKEKLRHLAKIWEEQASDLDNQLVRSEKQLVFKDAAIQSSHRVTNDLGKLVEKASRDVSFLRGKTKQLQDELDKKTEQAEAKEKEIDNISSRCTSLQQTCSVLETDLALSENECVRLKTELDRKNVERITRRNKSHSQGVQTVNSEKESWEKEKQKELLHLQKRFAASFKRQVATLLRNNKDISNSKTGIHSTSIESPSAVSTDSSHLFNLQDCTPPLNFTESPSVECPSQKLEQSPKHLQGGNVHIDKPPADQWTPEQSFERWKRRKGGNRNRIYGQ